MRPGTFGRSATVLVDVPTTPWEYTHDERQGHPNRTIGLARDTKGPRSGEFHVGQPDGAEACPARGRQSIAHDMGLTVCMSSVDDRQTATPPSSR